MRHVYKNLSLFSGAMGFDIGLEQSGRFETVAAIEFDKACCETIRRNRDAGRIGSKSMPVFEGDIRHIDPQAVMTALKIKRGELDLITAGPPCQAFSTSGKRRSVEDPRGTLLWRTIDYIETFQPKTFVIENVRGLLSAALKHRPINMRPEKGGPPLDDEELPGSVMKRFLEDVRARLGNVYRMDVFEVNAVNYGAPQIRERAIFIGNRLGAQMEFPDPTHGPDQIPFRTLGDALRNVKPRKNDVIMDFSPRKKRYLAMIPPGGNWRSLPEELQRESMGRAYLAKGGRSGWWRRLSSDLPSPTIVTMPNHSSTALTHPIEVRALTVRECAAVQEFPPNWELTGTPMEQYAQVGNAVPTRLGKVAGETLAEALDNGRIESAETLTAYRLVYLRSHVRTRKWFSGGENVVWKDGKDNTGAAYTRPVTERKVREFFSVAAE
ncbi:DNA cytosine methyltransferase [Agrobacterium tumefaciens]|uniref:Cytosine-specific methyltransferase n=1 Tax=Agrobacterium tumefaciens TaxID=358 RepID=A0A4D7YKR4_AGRTU|nr:DNA cytosine methyltransferase [Agrobacterium tumefaciens]QCL97931.1 DNA cytosine methyltransferase [Agrobacterium tumefaciens]